MAAEEYEVWKTRLDGLREQINKQCDVAADLINNGQTPYQKNSISALRELLACLDDFASKQFDYFYNGFFIKNKKPDLVPLKKFPPGNVMQATLDQVGFDLWVISNAISQRANQANNSILEKADFLSLKALEPTLGSDLGGKRVITYLLKSPSVRVIPYANTALIGIPQTVGKVPRDFLAIAHEVGHLVFWLGEVGGESIATILRREARKGDGYANRWIEEIFADVYGASVAGPALALSFQNLHLQVSQDEFFEDDWDHPPAILRPNIYNKVLKGRGFGNCAGELHKRWNGEKVGGNYQGGKIHERLEKDPKWEKNQDGLLEEVPVEPFDHAFKLANGQFSKIKEEMTIEPGEEWDGDKKIDYVVKSIYQKIHGSPGNGKWIDFGESWWLKDVVDHGDITKLFSDFDDKVAALTTGDIFLGGVELNSGRKIACVDHETLVARWIKEGESVAPDLREEYKWLFVFMAHGWTTEGPHSNPPPP